MARKMRGDWRSDVWKSEGAEEIRPCLQAFYTRAGGWKENAVCEGFCQPCLGIAFCPSILMQVLPYSVKRCDLRRGSVGVFAMMFEYRMPLIPRRLVDQHYL